MKIKMKCSYCKKEIIREIVEKDDKQMVTVICNLAKDNTILCECCISNPKARKWLADKILFEQ